MGHVYPCKVVLNECQSKDNNTFKNFTSTYIICVKMMCEKKMYLV